MIDYDREYQRVFPRDFFNEAKLLKCMGQVSLLIHDGKAPKNISFGSGYQAPEIGLSHDGALAVMNYPIYISGHAFRLRTTYNSKEPYPLHLWYHDFEVEVLDDEGNFTPKFIELCQGISP